MFDIFAKLLSSIASFLFPLFASYKALKTSDPAQLTPWLMYWVVLACALLVESWTEWFLMWIPLYPYVRLLFLLYLVLPQTQGARIIYTTYVHPYLEDNESSIEDLIATAHDKMKAAGMAYLKQAIELLRTQVLGMAPSPEAAQAESNNNIPASQRPRSYTQALLERFQLPAARWLPAGSNAAVGADFYNFLASAVTAAAGAAGAGENKENDPSASSAVPGVGAFPAGDMTASGTLVPPSIRDNADKMTFLAAQRERLNMVLSALDREAAQLRSSGATSPSVKDYNLDGLVTPSSSSNDRPMTSASAKSGLSKSRSEADFEKIDAESGAEEDVETARPVPARSGSWLPWGWGGAATEEKRKDE
ncbi:hypothetical protein N0V82_002201 [Gnomoniopsis sp. IMI 355080]|nr:hypothetical protein N0V82_002201 [Gnomoniopsis sp. IMI 355080]